MLRMELEQLRGQANARGIRESYLLTKVKLVRAIQCRLGQQPCFATEARWRCANGHCDYREDCCKPIAEWLR